MTKVVGENEKLATVEKLSHPHSPVVRSPATMRIVSSAGSGDGKRFDNLLVTGKRCASEVRERRNISSLRTASSATDTLQESYGHELFAGWRKLLTFQSANWCTFNGLGLSVAITRFSWATTLSSSILTENGRIDTSRIQQKSLIVRGMDISVGTGGGSMRHFPLSFRVVEGVGSSIWCLPFSSICFCWRVLVMVKKRFCDEGSAVWFKR